LITREDLTKMLNDVPQYKGQAVDATQGKWKPDGQQLSYKQGRKTYAVPQAVAQHATRLAKIPVAYAEKCPADLLAINLNYFMPSIGQMQMVTKGNDLVALTTPDKPILRSDKVVRKIETSVHPTEYRHLNIKPELVEIYAVGERREAVKRGDLVRGGAYMAYSPLGLIDPVVKGYAEILRCVNGMITSESTVVFHYGGEDGDVYSWLGKNLKAAYNTLKPETNRLREMSNQQINPSEMIDHVLRGIRGEETRNLIRARVMDNPTRTMYDLHNHVTFVASHEVQDPGTRHHLMTAASGLTEHRTCPVCHRAR
jgi:hypothetical protein